MTILNFIKKELSGWTPKEIVYFSSVIFIILLSSYITKSSGITITYTICGFLATILMGKGKISCYFFGIIACTCYIMITFKNSLYGSFLLNLCYTLPMDIIGIFVWKKHLKKSTNEIIKTALKNKERIIISALVIISSLLFSIFLNFSHAKFPVIDSFVTILSICAMYLTVRRCIEQWIAWTIVNILSATMWIILIIQGTKNSATLLMWLIYLALGIYFYIKWYKEIYTSK